MTIAQIQFFPLSSFRNILGNNSHIVYSIHSNLNIVRAMHGSIEKIILYCIMLSFFNIVVLLITHTYYIVKGKKMINHRKENCVEKTLESPFRKRN